MRCLIAFLLVLGVVLPALPQAPPPEPEIMVDHFRAYRENGRILLDGNLVVNRREGIKGMRLKFQVLAPGQKLISQEQTRLTKDQLDTGAEVPFYLQFADQSRAVYIIVDVRDGGNMVLTVDKPGPYPIE